TTSSKLELDQLSIQIKKFGGKIMSSKKIDGKAIGQEIRNELKEEVASLVAQGVQPGLAVILVGENPASETYVRNKEKSSKEAGMKSVLTKLPDTVSEQE